LAVDGDAAGANPILRLATRRETRPRQNLLEALAFGISITRTAATPRRGRGPTGTRIRRMSSGNGAMRVGIGVAGVGLVAMRLGLFVFRVSVFVVHVSRFVIGVGILDVSSRLLDVSVEILVVRLLVANI
jgi:hypothetical protein